MLHCLNIKDTTYEIKYTEDKGTNWHVLRKYRFTFYNIHPRRDLLTHDQNLSTTRWSMFRQVTIHEVIQMQIRSSALVDPM